MMQSNKMALRKKAMDSMMREKPAMEFKKRPMPDMEGQVEDAAESGEEPGEGEMVSFMVTPEEKEMILEMRQGKKGMKGKFSAGGDDEMMG